MSEIIEYITTGTCCKQMRIEVENDIVTYVKFNGGCMGNTQGVAKLVVGRKVDDIISLLNSELDGRKIHVQLKGDKKYVFVEDKEFAVIHNKQVISLL